MVTGMKLFLPRSMKYAAGPRQGVRLSGRRKSFPGGSDTAVQAVCSLESNPLTLVSFTVTLMKPPFHPEA